MAIEVALIRHGQVQTDGEERLSGITDVPLDGDSRRILIQKRNAGKYPGASVVYSSGLARCKETADIIYPSRSTILYEKRFNAPDYGDFDGRAISELKNDDAFRYWQLADSAAACPNGESPQDFSARVLLMFKKACEAAASSERSSMAIICHRTVISEILRRYYTPRSNYANWDVGPGCGYLILYDTETSEIQITDNF